MFFYGMTLLGMMYYVPQFFQLVYGFSATKSGVGLLPMMLGLCVGNPVAGAITSRYGVSVWNAVGGAALEVVVSGLMTRWDGQTSEGEAFTLLVLLGIGQGAVMSGLLVSAQAAAPAARFVGLVTGLVIFAMTVGDIFGIALFAAVYINRLLHGLHALALSPADVARILADVQVVRRDFPVPRQHDIIATYATSLQNGWWLMFASAVACTVLSLASKQHSFSR